MRATALNGNDHDHEGAIEAYPSPSPRQAERARIASDYNLICRCGRAAANIEIVARGEPGRRDFVAEVQVDGRRQNLPIDPNIRRPGSLVPSSRPGSDPGQESRIRNLYQDHGRRFRSGHVLQRHVICRKRQFGRPLGHIVGRGNSTCPWACPLVFVVPRRYLTGFPIRGDDRKGNHPLTQYPYLRNSGSVQARPGGN